jgi:hypothetical protein
MAARPTRRTFSYGEVPSLAAFKRRFATEMGAGSLYAISNSRRGIDGRYTASELYELVVELTAEWNQGHDDSGDLASSILETLGFEWV